MPVFNQISYIVLDIWDGLNTIKINYNYLYKKRVIGTKNWVLHLNLCMEPIIVILLRRVQLVKIIGANEILFVITFFISQFISRSSTLDSFVASV